MKKIFVLISSLVLCCSFFCFSAYAAVETIPFSQHFQMSYSELYGLELGTDYTRSVDYDQTGDSFTSAIYAVNPGDKDYKSWITNFYYTEDDVGAGILYDEYITFTLRFTVLGDFRTDDIQRAGVYVRNPSVPGGSFQWAKHYYAGDIDILSVSDDGLINCEAHVSFHNTYQDIERLRFFLAFELNNRTEFYENIETFSGNVYNFYKGSYTGAGADVPKYENPKDSVGSSVDDYKDQEDAIMNDTEAGRDSTISLFSGLGDLIDLVATPIMAISAAVSYFIDGSIVNSILLISLTLGLLSFVFNLVPSYQSKQRRDQAAARAAEKNVQYNAMMNKLNKGGG